MNEHRVVWCPICRSGWIIIAKEIETEKLFLYCKECESEWDNPLALIKRLTPTHEKYSLAESATFEEIRQIIWHKYLLSD